MSYKLVLIETSGRECNSGVRFATFSEANESFFELALRWMGCPLEYRVAESEDPVNYEMVNGRPQHINSIER